MNEQSLDYLISGALMLAFLAAVALYAYCIIDIHRHQAKYETKKAAWLNIIWLAPVIGCVIYLVNHRRIWSQPNSSY